MRLSSEEIRYFLEVLQDLLQNQEVKSMKNYIQHGTTSTYVHCIKVSYYSYWFCKRLHINIDTESLIRGAFLHDFYLYDWHDKTSHKPLHGFHHPGTALINANQLFKLNHLEQNIIKTHMWPLTFRAIPRYRESFIVCMVDKICSTFETLTFVNS